MEDLLSLIVIILYFVISVSASKKKKERKKAEKRAGGRRPVQFDQAFERVFSQISEQLERKNATEMQPQSQPMPREALRMEAAGEGDDPCHKGMLGEERASLHANTVTQIQMAEAAEGEDPCHVGSAPPDTHLDDAYSDAHSPIFDTEDADTFAQDVLRGVIMSEILMRPGGRRGYAGGKRGA